VTARVARPARDRGSVSILFAVGLVAILMIIGLSVDASGKLRAAAYASNIAAAAARTGAQQIDLAQAIPGGAKVIKKDAATAAVNAYVAGIGATAAPPVFSPNGLQITVTVTVTYQTKVLWIVNVNSLTVTGTATATLLDTP
jgi:hypothetical protein